MSAASAQILSYRSDPVYRREAFDWYIEDDASVRKLFDAIRFTGSIHDPCCGGGNIPRIAAELGYVATGSDIVDRGFGQGGVNFLDDETPRENIVFNPPYGKFAERCILHALRVASGRVAALVQLRFVCSQGRYARLFKPRPPEAVLPLATRPSMPPGGLPIEAKGGKIDYCWIVWSNERLHPSQPTSVIRWLP